MPALLRFRSAARLPLVLALALTMALGLTGALAQEALTGAISQTNSTSFPIVTANLTLVDGTGRPVVGLGRADFELFEDGQPVGDFQVGTAVDSTEPLVVALVIDTSGSMEGKPMADAKAAAGTFIQGLGPNDRAAVISFAEQARLVQPFTPDKAALMQAIASLDAIGDTALHDATILAAQALARETSGRRIAIIMSDGDDTASLSDAHTAVTAMLMAGAPAFTVGLGHNLDTAVLQNLASRSGGIALFAPSSADLQTAFGNIADQLRNQYVLTFRSALQADGGRHSLLVRARASGTAAEAQGSFVASSVPPEITIISPTEQQVLEGTVPVEVQVQAVAPIRKVEAFVAGRLVGSVSAEPFRFDWDTSRLARGNHVLDVVVYDELGNRGVKQVAVKVETVAPPTPTVTPTPTPAPEQAQSNNTPLYAGLGGVFVLAMLGLVAVRRRPRGPEPPYMKYERQRRKMKRPNTCPTCSKRSKGGYECPACAAEGQKVILQRLRELGGEPPEAEASKGDQA